MVLQSQLSTALSTYSNILLYRRLYDEVMTRGVKGMGNPIPMGFYGIPTKVVLG